MPWNTEGRKVNPAAQTILADTGPLYAGGAAVPQVIVSSSVATQVLFQLRDAADAVVRKEQLIVVPANSTFNLPLQNHLSDLQDNERLRLVTNAAITGQVQGSLFI